MVDARIPERYLNDRRILRLSFEAWWTYSFAMTWSVSNRTDGVIEESDIGLIPRANPGCAGELEKAGLWERRRNGWLILDFPTTQTSADELAVLENARRRDREKKARQRARRKDDPDDIPGDIPGGQSPATAQDRPGKDRKGFDVGSDQNTAVEDGAWPDPAPLGAGLPDSVRADRDDVPGAGKTVTPSAPPDYGFLREIAGKTGDS